MSWQILAFASVLLFSISAIIQKINIRGEKRDPIAFSILFQLCVGILIGIYGFINRSLVFPSILPLLLNLLLMIVFWTGDNIFYFRAMKYTDISKLSILFSTRVLFTVAASSVFLHQSLNAKQGIGTVLILLGVIAVSIKGKKFTFTKYDIYTFLAAALIGFAFTNDKVLLNHFNSYTYAMLAFLVPGFSLWLINPKVTKEMKYYLNGIIFFRFLLNVIIYTIAAITFYLGLKLTPNASQFASINVSTVVFIVLLSIIFLKERENLWQTIVGAVLSFVGLLLVTS